MVGDCEKLYQREVVDMLSGADFSRRTGEIVWRDGV